MKLEGSEKLGKNKKNWEKTMKNWGKLEEKLSKARNTLTD